MQHAYGAFASNVLTNCDLPCGQTHDDIANGSLGREIFAWDVAHAERLVPTLSGEEGFWGRAERQGMWLSKQSPEDPLRGA